MEEEEAGGGAAMAVVERLVKSVAEISAISDFGQAYKKELCNLSRRIKLLAPMFDELIDSKVPIPVDVLRSLASLQAALNSALDLLRFGSEGSKLFMVLERDKNMKRFQDVTVQLEQALGGISLEKLDISDEVREQVELVHAQLQRAKDRVHMPDVELYNDLASIYNKSTDLPSIDPSLLHKLADKLQLMSISDLKQESLALHELVAASDGRDPGENIEKMSMLLKKIKDFVLTNNLEMSTTTDDDAKHLAPVIPDDFRCPISLELMEDPVIVASGQTYERRCIKKWLEGGHDTCPKTQLKLPNMSLTTNYVLRSLISQWCEANGVECPKRPSLPISLTSACSSSEHNNVDSLLLKLSSPNPDEQRSAAGELRLLAKRNSDNRICIAEAGAIPLLAGLLLTVDTCTQEHAVTALLNLSIYEENKARIISSGAVPGIVHVLRNGSMEARENAAATIFSLSVVDENKVTIGATGAIPALVSLLSVGSPRGKKDAATALFNLCIYQGNKGKAVRAGLVPTLMVLLRDPAGGMVDEALAILAILSNHHEGKAAIGAAKAVPMLVDVIRSGSPRNRENAAAVLLHLCGGEQLQHHIEQAQECGVMGPLLELASNGTERGKRKANQLLERMSRFLDRQKQFEAQAEVFIAPGEQSGFLGSTTFSGH
ncbi:protein spotted leaf 11-like [Dioscorea cayenensis subsp. rotundata]|uniref:U-box domain-containing protein 12 n=1 Tax=Dioscorea cayennensis subsp. rotundata TaxID=55577 RepID=A0AB40CXT7_DIOCR|nr:protein spotted leaf 11-like [Dioscorea cayenensis subsp. rotundata]